MKKRELVRELWESYRQSVLRGAPQVQVDECEMAFYAGAGAIVKFTAMIAEMPEAKAIATLNELHAEMDSFALKMSAKAAAKRGH